jgi:hypothetical protein
MIKVIALYMMLLSLCFFCICCTQASPVLTSLQLAGNRLGVEGATQLGYALKAYDAPSDCYFLTMYATA